MEAKRPLLSLEWWGEPVGVGLAWSREDEPLDHDERTEEERSMRGTGFRAVWLTIRDNGRRCNVVAGDDVEGNGTAIIGAVMVVKVISGRRDDGCGI